MTQTNATSNKTPLIYRFYDSPLTGEEIEVQSMEMIDQEAPSHRFSPEEWQVIRRMVHTTGDFTLIDAVRFSPTAISSGVDALKRGMPIYADSSMIQAGLSLQRLRSVCQEYDPKKIVSHINDEEVAKQAFEAGLPRSLFALRKGKPILNGALIALGNAPIALLELNRMIIEEGVKPALVIAMVVGFVHVVESKEELMALGVPYIALAGRRGGSPLAVSVVHALCSIATGQREKWLSSTREGDKTEKEAILLLGHGSRVPEAGKRMEEVAHQLKRRHGYPWVEVCFVSRLGPHFSEVFERCVKEGAQKVLVIPYFLHEGLHLLLDIPEMMQEEAKKFPHVKLILGKGLGFDERLVDLVRQRIEESKDLCDVRNLRLPGREEYPVPPGQHEFVPMLPDEAAKYRR